MPPVLMTLFSIARMPPLVASSVPELRSTRLHGQRTAGNTCVDKPLVHEWLVERPAKIAGAADSMAGRLSERAIRNEELGIRRRLVGSKDNASVAGYCFVALELEHTGRGARNCYGAVVDNPIRNVIPAAPIVVLGESVTPLNVAVNPVGGGMIDDEEAVVNVPPLITSINPQLDSATRC